MTAPSPKTDSTRKADSSNRYERSLGPEPTDRCIHCGATCSAASLGKDRAELQFCCSGCEAAYKLIHDLGLKDFYRLRQLSATPVAPASRYRHFDDEQFLLEYTRVGSGPKAINQSPPTSNDQAPNDQAVSSETTFREVLFHLSGVHCAACVWLLEQLPRIDLGVLAVQPSFADSTLHVRYNPSRTTLSAVATLLARLGYPPTPVVPDTVELQRKKEGRQLLLRLGVAAFAAANTMIFAVSLYQGWFSGIDPGIARLMNFLSLILTLPAITYSAWPFYRAAIGGLRARVLHIDLPLSLALLVAFFLSVANTLRGSDVVYYDTICALIFLLLCGRVLQRRGLEQAVRSADLLASQLPLEVQVESPNGEITERYIGSVKVGDIVHVPAGARIPVDGRVVSGSSEINSALLTGESLAERITTHSPVYAGTENLLAPISVRVEATRHDTRLGKLTQTIESAARQRSAIVSFTDRVAAGFVSGVLVLAVLTAIYWYLVSGSEAAISNALGLLVVSCPCALGFAAPLALGIAIRRASTGGILIKGADTIERLTQIRRVVFDKTGTLTTGNGTLQYTDQPITPEIGSIISALESGNTHPVGLALLRYCEGHQPATAKLDPPQPGGISGLICSSTEERWAIGSPQFISRWSGVETDAIIAEPINRGLTPILLAKPHQVIRTLGVGDTIRPEASGVISRLKSQGVKVEIFSGDRNEIVNDVATLLAIDSAKGQLSPEDKAKLVTERNSLSPTAMIGDGANDSAALKAASVGIAVRGGAELAVQVSDVYLVAEPMLGLERLFTGARRTMGVIRLNLWVSLFYNTVGVVAAMAGYVSPLLAAILMPLSSLSVIASCILLPSFEDRQR